jgi:gas vesicle protein
MADTSYGADFFAGFVVGALVGAAAAILLAPQSGEETRAMIRERGIELQERSAEMSAEARRRATEYQAQAKDRAQQLSAQTRDKAAGWQGRMQEAVDQGKAAAGQQKEDLMTELQEQEPVQEPPANT